jgi:site-specific DNA recombinase
MTSIACESRHGYVGYYRVSDDEQVKNNSLATQQRDVRAYAERNTLPIVAELFDDFTGTVMDRPEFKKLLRMVRERRIAGIITLNSGRLTRNPADGMHIRELLLKTGTELHYVQRGKVDLSASGDLISGFEDLMARGYILQMKEATMRGRWGKAEGVKRAPGVPGQGYTPYGYEKVGEPRDGKIAVVPQLALVIRDIFRQYTIERMPVRQIAAALNEQAVRPPGAYAPGSGVSRAKRDALIWTETQVYRILRNETYAGTFHCRRRTMEVDEDGTMHTVTRPPEEWIGVPVEAIIARELWQETQQRLRGGRAASPRNSQHASLLGRRLRCGCGYAMQFVRRKDTLKDGSISIRPYYRCASQAAAERLVQGYCGQRSIRAADLEDLAWGWIESLVIDPRTTLAGWDDDRRAWEAEQTDAQAELAEIDAAIARQERELNLVRDKLLDPGWQGDDDQRYLIERKRQVSELRGELVRKRGPLAATFASAVVTEEAIIGLEQFRDELGDALYLDTSIARRRAILERLDITAALGMRKGRKVLLLYWRGWEARLRLSTHLHPARTVTDSDPPFVVALPLPLPRRAAMVS